MTGRSSEQDAFANTTIGALIAEHGGSIKTGPFGTTLKAAEYSLEGVPLISVGEIGYGTITVHDKTPRVSPLVTERLPEYLLQRGDIVFGRKGAVDRSALVRAEQAGWFLGSDGIRLRLPKGPNAPCDPVFVAYCLQESQHRAWILQHATGTTMASLNQGIIERVPIPLPPLPEQRAIAGVLGALDDKIEVNRKMAQVLEGIARAVFTSWFVDFDPVRRAAAGQPTGLPTDLAALFAKRLVDSPIGEVPEGWRVAPLPEAFEVNPTRSLKKGAPAPYLDMSNMPTQGHAPAEWVQREAGSGMRFVNGDTLVARITPCLENGKTAFVDFLDDNEVAWGSTEYIVLRPMSPLPPVFAYLLARDEHFRTHAIQAMTGSSGRQRVPAESLDHFQIAVPSKEAEEIAGKFAAVVEPLFARMSMAMQQNRTLAALRDALLPKLISGELRISDVEKIVGKSDRIASALAAEVNR